MRIHFKKVRDGAPSLACVRSDGSRTWGRVHAFFPIHDFTHVAVETVLGLDQGFFGLIAAGWGIDDFAEPGAAARMPVQAMWAEYIVGLLDQERGMGRPLPATEFSDALATTLRQHGRQAFRALTGDELWRIRTRRDELAARWETLPPGSTLAVDFPLAGAPI